MKNKNISVLINIRLFIGSILILNLGLFSCEDFVDVDLPQDQITGEVVFKDNATVEAALGHIYAQLRETAFSNGRSSGVSYLMGHYADELDLNAIDLPNVQVYADNNVLPSDNTVKSFWDTGYAVIYEANRIIEGVGASSELLEADRERFMGEAKFIRGYVHFYLMNLFGPVPYITDTDYRINREVARMKVEEVYQYLIADLLEAKGSLPTGMVHPSKLRVDHWTVSALLARTYLYHGEWDRALSEANYVISGSGASLEADLDKVFLTESPETLWQLDVAMNGTNTYEGFTFIVNAPPPNSSLSTTLIAGFEIGDQRLSSWVGSVSDGSSTWYFPYKYKQGTNTEQTLERSIMVRLGEVYLIAAEAAARSGALSEALSRLNAIRSRAGLPVIASVDQGVVLEAIWDERQVELFTELGHRFFDLKRTGRVTEVLGALKPDWQNTDRLLPLPESELLINPNLEPQNEGY
ncbi:RagB/SusD family nutrient uptake outer membrane protein [Flagellimonas beolgyonensis]|uniref:RagB/SusD family nutrient uptake outer membrane protein n=1 Tax=Flagellimonas beolgyonensis TaxID=864064 RepID=UPI000F8DBD39|nr:RagB/SusD family nutrient uptake outer membrane protein [Allomuricauda beolgyonensis]